jgi:hypothetical protein
MPTLSHPLVMCSKTLWHFHQLFFKHLQLEYEKNSPSTHALLHARRLRLAMKTKMFTAPMIQDIGNPVSLLVVSTHSQ